MNVDKHSLIKNSVLSRIFLRTTGVMVAVSILTLSNVMSASAGDYVIYPGSNCVQVGGTANPSMLSSMIGNPSSSSWLYLDCPVDLIRDGRIDVGFVYVLDKHYYYDISCGMANVWIADGGVTRYHWSGYRYSSGSGSSRQRLWMNPLGTNYYSHTYIGCRIPPKFNNNISSIISYTVKP